MLSEKLEQENASYIFQKMLDAVPISMLLVDLNGKIVFANRYSEQLFGYSQNALLNHEIELLIPERLRLNHPDYRNNYMKLPKIRPMGLGRDIFGVRIDGSEVPVEVGLTPLRIEAGFFILASIVDISERELVKEQLTTEEGRKRRLEIVNNQLSEFAHIVSHDLTDPFLKIESFLPKMIEGNAEAGQVVKDSIGRGKKLISDLLTYAQSAAPQMTEVNLTAVVSDILKLYPRNNFNLQPLPTIKGDATGMRQLFSNLLSNAMKFERSGVKNEVKIGVKDGVFSVEDNGIGIATDQIPKLFTPFFRVHPKEKYPGTGLGLSICKKVVESHHGKIWIESELGKGTTVFFTLTG